MSEKIIHVVSISTGKDSVAAGLLCLEKFPRDQIRWVFADTGNEHQDVYDYIRYLEQALNISITILKSDFSEQIKNKRKFIANDRRVRRQYKQVPALDEHGDPVQQRQPGSGDLVFDDNGQPVYKTRKGSGVKTRWTNKAKRRALSVLHPTGNPFLDLCLWKGRFPSRRAQFCTQHLKTIPMIKYQNELVDQGYTVISWQGVRRDESANRRDVLQIEDTGADIWQYRPIADWSAMDCIKYSLSKGIGPNPLYRKGMDRVGCMPCINCSKDQLRAVADRFPEEIERIERWEQKVSLAGKRGFSTMFHKHNELAGQYPKDIFRVDGIRGTVAWSRTSRGGKTFDLIAATEDATACSSSYGLCE